MTKAQIALACRAVACRGWRWLPGMLYQYREESDEVTFPTKHYWCDPTRVRDHDPDVPACFGGFSAPDLTDPATLGCLLALVREAFPGCHAEPNGAPEWDGYDEEERSNWWAVFSCGPHRLMATGATEAEALVAALEAAP